LVDIYGFIAEGNQQREIPSFLGLSEIKQKK
jgi:hypothetical protein